MNTKIKAVPSGNGNQIQFKDTSFLSEVQTIFHYLQRHVATASMVSDATGIKQKNICRFKRQLEKAEMLWEVERKTCKITGYKAWNLTANPNLAPNNHIQLNF